MRSFMEFMNIEGKGCWCCTTYLDLHIGDWVRIDKGCLSIVMPYLGNADDLETTNHRRNYIQQLQGELGHVVIARFRARGIAMESNFILDITCINSFVSKLKRFRNSTNHFLWKALLPHTIPNSCIMHLVCENTWNTQLQLSIGQEPGFSLQPESSA